MALWAVDEVNRHSAATYVTIRPNRSGRRRGGGHASSTPRSRRGHRAVKTETELRAAVVTADAGVQVRGDAVRRPGGVRGRRTWLGLAFYARGGDSPVAEPATTSPRSAVVAEDTVWKKLRHAFRGGQAAVPPAAWLSTLLKHPMTPEQACRLAHAGLSRRPARPLGIRPLPRGGCTGPRAGGSACRHANAGSAVRRDSHSAQNCAVHTSPMRRTYGTQCQLRSGILGGCPWW